jgi:hypothetical protein
MTTTFTPARHAISRLMGYNVPTSSCKGTGWDTLRAEVAYFHTPGEFEKNIMSRVIDFDASVMSTRGDQCEAQ